MEQSPLTNKLKYKEGPAAVVNAPEGFSLGIEADSSLDGTYQLVLGFVKNAEEATKWIPEIIAHLNDDALFWICYPKQSSKIKTDINRDSLWKLVEELTEYRLVSNVAVDDTWSALRLRHRDKVKK